MNDIRQKSDAGRTARTGIRRFADATGRALLLLLAMVASAGAIAAVDQQALADIERAAEQFLATRAHGEQGEATSSALDRRLSLPRCDLPLEPFMRAGAKVRQRTIVGVRCNGSKPWKVYVPVNLVMTAPVLVLERPLPRGHLLTAEDLAVTRRDVSRMSGGYIGEVSAAVGQRLKQSLRAGSVVTPAVLAAKLLVRRGQTVTLSANAEEISIRMAGKALMDGALNQRIRVENLASGRIVEGLVRSAERVEVLVQ